MHKRFRFLDSCPNVTPWFIVIGLLLLLAPAATAATIEEGTRAHMTRVWQGQFAAPQLFGSAPSRTPLSGLPPPTEVTSIDKTYTPGAHLRNDRPHPAVVRVIVPEDGATSYGSGTLIDVRDQFGLVITNWHVVRDAQGPVEVLFPCGYRSKARALKVDADWDLAALVVWRPPTEPVRLSVTAPQPGDQLTICGYGQGMYRSVTGRCTQYYAPRADFPQQMVELDVQARQGDSGGPIFNDRGELAGVLFGAGQGTTLGSFGGRVESFLATLAPDIGKATDGALVCCQSPTPDKQKACDNAVSCLPQHTQPETEKPSTAELDDGWSEPEPQLAGMWATVGDRQDSAMRATLQQSTDDQQQLLADAPRQPARTHDWFEQTKTALAAIGLLTLSMLLLKAAC
jgi:hypothetical protein